MWYGRCTCTFLSVSLHPDNNIIIGNDICSYGKSADTDEDIAVVLVTLELLLLVLQQQQEYLEQRIEKLSKELTRNPTQEEENEQSNEQSNRLQWWWSISRNQDCYVFNDFSRDNLPGRECQTPTKTDNTEWKYVHRVLLTEYLSI